MATDSKKSVTQSVRNRTFLAKDFDALRQDIVEYERTFYDDKIRDFSDSGLGGALVDMAAYVGDTLSFYLDHQFSELSPEDAVENVNIERLLRQAGVEITGASPAVVETTWFFEVPAESDGIGGTRPMRAALPVVQAESVVLADNGVQFVLLDDVDFTALDKHGNLKATARFGDVSSAGVPLTYIVSRTGFSLSGFRVQEQFPIGSDFVPFREITLSNPNVSEIAHITDDLGNTYYLVDQLTQDVVYKGVLNLNSDDELVNQSLQLVPAPYRFIKRTSTASRLTTLVFGGGSADTLADDVIPDPSDFALPLYGKTTFTRRSIDPGTLLNTKTLGVAATNVTLTVTYQHGGGLNHNVIENSIKTISTLKLYFPNSPSAALAARVRATADVRNFKRASGGEDPPSIDELRANIPAAKNAQSRVVTTPDLLSRVYTLPSNFGRVFRAGVRSNPNNPLVTDLFIISRDVNSKLIVSPDTLKKNLVKYLNAYRMISDAVDIYDARVVNLGLSFQISVDPNIGNKNLVLQTILTRLKKFFDVKNFNIDQPVIMSDVRNIIFNNTGVVSVNQLKFSNITGRQGANAYSDVIFDIDANTRRDMLIPPPGGIFEVRFPDQDLVGVAN